MSLIDLSILAVIMRVTTPVLLATTGALYSERSGVPNITMEGSMLFGTFLAVVGSYFFGSSLIGTLFAIFGGIFIALIFAFLVLKLGGDEVVVGVAINVIVGGLTILLLTQVFDASGSFVSPEIIGLPKVGIPILDQIPFLKEIFSGQTIIVFIAFLSVLVTHIVINKTPFGMKIKACGENPLAAATVGVNVNRIRLICIIITGALSGLAGAQISLGFLSMFSENMTAGKGYIAIAAIIFARAIPVRVLLVSLLFGFAEALSNILQLLKVPAQIVLMLPYLFVIIFLVFNFSRFRKGKMKNTHSNLT
jgi:general nucleoside transport system permease protein